MESNLEQDLRTVSDEMLRTIEQLQDLENQKRAEKPGTARFLKLAAEIERLAGMIFNQTSQQEELAEKTHIAAQLGAPVTTPIEDVTPSRDVGVILSEWRDAERRLSATGIDTADHSKAAADVRRLRDEYHRYYEAQKESPTS
jgi:hypothetical protein